MGVPAAVWVGPRVSVARWSSGCLQLEAMRAHGEEIPDEPEQLIVTRLTVPIAS
jgi:hypothetical protein